MSNHTQEAVLASKRILQWCSFSVFAPHLDEPACKGYCATALLLLLLLLHAAAPSENLDLRHSL